MSKFYVTTPIYYVNDKPHIGHAYTTILADVLSRGHRLLGQPVHFLTGTDEHGLKVQQAAQKNGVTPQQHCDRTVVRFQELWQKLGITHDDFIRTTEPRHERIVQAILQDLFDRGEIYASNYEGWYCVPCERFFTEKDLVDGCCPDCHRGVERLVEKNYFFRMGKYQQRLIEYIEQHPEFIQPSFRRQETLGFLQKQPLADLCISRPKARLAWGIDLPFDPDYVTYVWFDALVNYISAVGYKSDPEQFSHWWPASYHLIGKDILTTHTVYWPTMLMAMGVELPRAIYAHGWWLLNGEKVSKSKLAAAAAKDTTAPAPAAAEVPKAPSVNPMAMADQYGVDALRYFLMAAMSMGQDAEFSEEAFVSRFNAELANDLGNLVSRAVKMLHSYCRGILPAATAPGPAEEQLLAACQQAVRGMTEGIEKMQLDRGIAEVIAAVREGNRYFDANKPWQLAKEGQQERLASVLRNTAECLRVVSGLLYPTMPGKMRTLRLTLGLAEENVEPVMHQLSSWNALPDGAVVLPLLEPLFPRIPVDAPESAPVCSRKKPAPAPKSVPAAPAAPSEEGANLVTIADFSRIELRTAEVLTAERVEGADRLLRLQLQVGQETRQIVAGIAKFYPPEELPGRTIVIVANLQPRELRGLRSCGMLLAAKHGDQLRLITPDGPIASGASVG